MPAPIAILGAGPSGLSLARLLSVNKIDYQIFERDASGNELGQGGSLDIHAGSGQLALKEGGLLEEFQKVARYDAQEGKIVDRNGEFVLSTGDNESDSAPEIDRKKLRRLLLDAVPEGKIRWAAKVKTVRREEDGTMGIEFVDGTTEKGFQLIVGADGAWSKARALITDAKPEYSGLHYISASLPTTSAFHSKAQTMAGKGTLLAVDSGKQIAAQCNGDGSYNIMIGLSLPEHWATTTNALANPDAFRARVIAEHFADWNSNITDLIKHTEGPIRAWPLYAMPISSLSWKSVSGATLVGDAAHVSTPFVGEGVNTALYDTVQLAREIVRHGIEHLDQAVEAYEKLMLPRGINLITRSTESGKLLFAPDAPRGFTEMADAMRENIEARRRTAQEI